MKPKDIEVNDNIEIEVKTGFYKGKYQSRISNNTNGKLQILMPYNQGKIIPLSPGVEVNILIALDTSAFKFRTHVIDRIKNPIIEGVSILSKTTRRSSLPDGKAIGIKFIDINQRTRDALMGWLFDQQRKLRRKGLL